MKGLGWVIFGLVMLALATVSNFAGAKDAALSFGLAALGALYVDWLGEK